MSLKRDPSPPSPLKLVAVLLLFHPPPKWRGRSLLLIDFNNHSTFSSLETFFWSQRKICRSTDRVCVRGRGQTEARGTNKQCRLVAKGPRYIPHPSRRQRPTSAAFLAGAKQHIREVNNFSCFLLFALFALELFMARDFFPPPPWRFHPWNRNVWNDTGSDITAKGTRINNNDSSILCVYLKFADCFIIVSTAIHNPRQSKKKEKCVWVRHIIVRVRVRVSTESPLPKHKKEKKEIVAVTDRLWNYLGRSFFHRIRKREWNAQTRAPTKQEKKPWRLWTDLAFRFPKKKDPARRLKNHLHSRPHFRACTRRKNRCGCGFLGWLGEVRAGVPQTRWMSMLSHWLINQSPVDPG